VPDPEGEAKILTTTKIKIKTTIPTPAKITILGNVFLGGGGTTGGMLTGLCGGIELDTGLCILVLAGIVYVFGELWFPSITKWYHIVVISAISFKKKNIHTITIFLSLIIVFLLGPFLFYNINFMGRIYPNIYINRVDVGGRTPSDAVLLLSESVNAPTKINLVSQTQSFELNTKDIDMGYDFAESADRAYNLTRTGNFFLDSFERIRLVTGKENIGLATNINEAKLANFISIIAGQVNVNPIYPSVENISGNVQINKGTAGSQIDGQLLRATIGRNLSYADPNDINIPMEIIDPTLDSQQVNTAKIRGEKYLGKSLTLKFESQSYNYNESDIFNFINPAGGYNNKVLSDAISKVAASINRDPQDPKFEFNGNKVTEFQPALDGISLDSEKLKELLTSDLDKLADTTDKNISLDVPVIKTSPNVTTDQVNNLGIKELIGRGDSTYFHSIPGRVFNINLAASRINGTLVAPGDTFSFNQTLGDVSKFTGYQQAYIISGGRTVLGDGGGVCQVSTTLFRAVLNAGLSIIERAAHAYRVGYYEQNSPPGLDATVYAPSPDFKFKNDTPGYILIEAKNDSRNYSLVFEIYGTNDGRVATISKPVVSDITSALPTVYQDDPTLPIGTLKQTDFAAAGAKVVFNYSVVRAGQQIYQKTFVSNYQPWAAVYLRGTGTAQ
jgi:vancomycin resistance protein YoaR